MLRLVDYLIALLQAQAQTLQRLAALFGEEVLLEMLEIAGDDETPKLDRKEESLEFSTLFDPVPGEPDGSTYRELESSVHELKLSPVLEFHLWAYPTYREFIEASHDLRGRVRVNSGATAVLVEYAIRRAEDWLQTLPIPPEHSQQARRAMQVPWLRFRTELFKRVGQKPFATT